MRIVSKGPRILTHPLSPGRWMTTQWSAAVHFFLKWGVLTMGWGYILTKWSYINYWTARAFPPSAMPIFIMGSIVGLRRASTPTPTSGADVEKWRARADLMTIGLLLWMAVSSTYS